MGFIGEDLFHFQATIGQSGSTFEEFVRENYVNKWVNDDIYNAMNVRTTLVTAINNYLVNEGLLNLERVQMSPVTPWPTTWSTCRPSTTRACPTWPRTP